MNILLPLLLAFFSLLVGRAPAAGAPSSAEAPRPLFNGKDLSGWKKSGFATQGEAEVEASFKGGPPALILDATDSLNGVTYTNPVPRDNFEISLEAMKLNGSDFFCGLTFPVGEAHCTFVCGGWGGAVVGISSVDGSDASENETTKFLRFDKEKWYRIRVRVTPAKIEAWIDDEKLADLAREGRKISMRPGEIEEAVPLSLTTYQTRSAFRKIELKTIGPAGK
jgi:hypothetical protein